MPDIVQSLRIEPLQLIRHQRAPGRPSTDPEQLLRKLRHPGDLPL